MFKIASLETVIKCFNLKERLKNKLNSWVEGIKEFRNFIADTVLLWFNPPNP